MTAVGCGEDGDEIINQISNQLSNNDQFPASSIASNNLAPDGGGMSPNKGSVTGHRVIYCCDCCGSDGDSSGSDNSALLLFTYADNGGHTHLYASHYNGSTFTAPTRLKFNDRNETTGINLAAIVATPLLTSGYTASDQTVTADVRNNNGAWVFIVDYFTWFNDPRLSQTATVTGLEGAHRAIAQFVFIPALRELGRTTDDAVGGIVRDFENGFLCQGIQLEKARNGVGPTIAQINAAGGNLNADGSYVPVPASNVMSYGLVSDAFCKQTCYGGNGTPATAQGGGGFVNWGNATPVSGAPTFASFQGCEAASCLALFYTQLVTSLNDGGSFSEFGVNHGGADVDLVFHGFNLATLTFEAAVTMNPPAGRNAETDTVQQGGTAWFPTFYSYNKCVFFKYLDMSLNQNSSGITNTDRLSSVRGGGDTWTYTLGGGHNGGFAATNAFYEEIICWGGLVDDGDGTTSMGSVAGSTAGGPDALHDLSITGTTAGGNHDTTPVPTGGLGFTANLGNGPKRELANFNGGTQFIFGDDEGLKDYTIFFVASDGTNDNAADIAATGSDGNVDIALIGAGLDVAATNPTFVTNGEPRRLTLHQEDFHAGTDPIAGSANRTSLSDPLLLTGANRWFVPCINRTGQYVTLAYLQDEGLSTNFRQALKLIAYQTCRSSVSSTNGQPVTTNVNFDQRFAGPVEVSGTLAITTINHPNNQSRLNNAETRQVWNSIAVNSFMYQGKCAYRCGIQSDSACLNLLYEQSDGTEDRLFVRGVQVAVGTNGTPTITQSTAAEIEATANVAGHANFNTASGLPSSSIPGRTATFRFLDGDVVLGTTVQACDLGADASGNGGGLLIVYRQTTDGSSNNNRNATAQIKAIRYVKGTLDSAAVNIGRDIHEEAPLHGIGLTGFLAVDPGGAIVPGVAEGANSAGAGAYGGAAGFDSTLLGSCTLVCVPNNDNIEQNPSYSADAIYVYFRAPTVNNTSGARGLFTRKFDASIRANSQLAGQVPVFGDRFTPTAGTGPGSTTFQDAKRLDHQNNNVLNVQCCQTGTSALVMFMQDDHVWAQITRDGENYVETNGAPNPYLVDNDSSDDALGYTLWCCPNDGDVANFIVGMNKEDSNSGGGAPGAATGDLRLRLRSGTTF